MSRLVLWFLATTVASAILHGLLYRQLGARGASPRVRRGVVALFFLAPIGRLVTMLRGPDALSWVEAVAQLEFLGLLVAVPILLVLDTLLSLRASRARVVSPAIPLAAPTRRAALEEASALGVALVAGFAPPVFGVLRGRKDLEVVEVPVRLARLPRALDGFTLVQVSDIHVGPFLGEHDLARIADRVAELRADLIVMTGDLVHHHRRHIPLAAAWLRRLAQGARFGGAAIPGNHEHYVGRDAVLDAVAATGVRVLVDRHVRIAGPDGGGFLLGGVEDAFHGSFPERAFRGAPPELARILLAHQPQVVPDAAVVGVDLQLSGHTHGGQIQPLGPGVVRVLYPWVAGRYQHGPTTLYVNRGLGTSGPPARVGIPPEITKIVLVAG